MRRIVLACILALTCHLAAAFAGDALPSLESLQYPGSTKVGEFKMGETSSLQFDSTDDFKKVVDHYKPKFPDQQMITEDGAYFGKAGTNGDMVSVTIAKDGDKTKIVLMRQDPPAKE